MRAGQGTFRPEGILPLVPPVEEDELISSWLGRTARFYGLPLQALLHRAGRPSHPVELSAVDLGMARTSLKPITTLLGIGIEPLAAHTIAAAYPWATGLVARSALASGHLRGPKLRYAACPHCLEEQRLERGVSWLRRAWVLAPRTVCSVHRVPLIAMQPGGTTHPLWSDFRHRHRQAGLEAPAITPPSQLLSNDGPPAVLHREMAMVRDAILAAASRGQQRAGAAGEGRGGHCERSRLGLRSGGPTPSGPPRL